MSGGLSVAGGVGGLYADLFDMRATADRLDDTGDALRQFGLDAAGMAGDGDIVASAILSPGTAAAATGQLLDAAGKLAIRSLAVESRARVMRLTADAYEFVDHADMALTDLRQDLLAEVLGRTAIPLALLTGIAATDTELVILLGDLLSGDVPLSQIDDRFGELPGDIGGRLNDWSMDLLFTFPGLTDVVAGSPDHFLPGLLGLPPGIGTIPGFDFEEGVMALLGLGSLVGLGQDGSGYTLGEVDPPEDAGPPNSIEEIFLQQTNLQQPSVANHDASRVRVVEVTMPDGTTGYVVQVPGTQEWSLRAGSDLADATTNLALEAEHDAVLLDAIDGALAASGADADSPILLTGHSQGGIAAAAYAASPEHGGQRNVTHVVTGGSPIARIPIPDDVEVLALEHDTDPVPRVEGDPNPQSSNVTTVTAHVDGPFRNVIGPHSSDLYAETGRQVDASDDPSITHALDGIDDYYDPAGTVHDFEIERTP